MMFIIIEAIYRETSIIGHGSYNYNMYALFPRLIDIKNCKTVSSATTTTTKLVSDCCKVLQQWFWLETENQRNIM